VNLYPVVKKTQEPTPIDVENEILHVCLCGSRFWNVQVTFDDFEVASYLTDMSCAVCGQKAKAPTQIDSPAFKAWREITPDDIPNAAYFGI